MSAFAHEHLVHGELPVEVAPDLVQHVRVDGQLRETVVRPGVTLHHVVASAQVLPRTRAQRRGDALPTPTPHLARNDGESQRQPEMREEGMVRQ